ncbi:energy transducer TonB (plasmid) [Polymorphobacter sp. PAMC 29334]|nr:energy transducer TonB [Polymorphobacter sp. PAMC 29334]
MEIVINQHGHVSDCRVTAPSGQPDLDEEACWIAFTQLNPRPAHKKMGGLQLLKCRSNQLVNRWR